MAKLHACPAFVDVLTCWAVVSLLAPVILGAPLGPWQQGTASFFGGPTDPSSNAYKLTIDSGSCGYGDIDPRLYPFYNVVGLHSDNSIVKSRAEAACGSCLEVQCIDGNTTCSTPQPLTAVITDQCDRDCNATNVNMHVFAFEQLAPLRFGRMHIRYRLVECEPADPIIIFVNIYRPSEGGWIRVAFKNLAGDAALVAAEIAPSGSNYYALGRALNASSPWKPMLNSFGAMWESSNLPQPPLDIRLTNTLGHKVVIANAITVPGYTGDIETTAQFPMATSVSPGRHADVAAVVPAPPTAAVPATAAGTLLATAGNDIGASPGEAVNRTAIVPAQQLPSAAANPTVAVPAAVATHTAAVPAAAGNKTTTAVPAATVPVQQTPAGSTLAAPNHQTTGQVTIGTTIPKPAPTVGANGVQTGNATTVNEQAVMPLNYYNKAQGGLPLVTAHAVGNRRMLH